MEAATVARFTAANEQDAHDRVVELEVELAAARGTIVGYCEALEGLRATLHAISEQGVGVVRIESVRRFIGRAHEQAAGREYEAKARVAS